MTYDQQLTLAALLRTLAERRGVVFAPVPDRLGEIACEELPDDPGVGCRLDLGDGLSAVMIVRDCIIRHDQPLARGWYFYDSRYCNGYQIVGSLNLWGGSLPRLETVAGFTARIQALIAEP